MSKTEKTLVRKGAVTCVIIVRLQNIKYPKKESAIKIKKVYFVYFIFCLLNKVYIIKWRVSLGEIERGEAGRWVRINPLPHDHDSDVV